MSEPPIDPITYLVYLEDDAIPLQGNATFGNHLDNDIVVAGEDVLDFHLRIEVGERGPVAIPLGEATMTVNGEERSLPLPLGVGDTLSIGQSVMQLGMEVERASLIDGWSLVSSEGMHCAALQADVLVGRSADAAQRKLARSREHQVRRAV